MGLKPIYTPGMVAAYMKNATVRVERAIEDQMRYLGEECVNWARDMADFKDQTANLRNSIGYIILKNGREIGANFEKTGKPNPKAKKTDIDGLEVGEAYAKKIAAEYTSGYVLILVAGMEYAAAVEAKGRDVLSSAEQLAMEEMPKLKVELLAAINRMRA